MHTGIQRHWEEVYDAKEDADMSWTQLFPATSMRLIHQLSLPSTAPVIDVGAGNSRLVDHLLEEGYRQLTVLDVSEKALEKSKNRLGNRREDVQWIAQDIRQFDPVSTYDLWHDRATFHFLTSEHDIAKYREVASKAVSRYMIIGTFSNKGPATCSGLKVKNYREDELAAVFHESFEKINSLTEDHLAPWGTRQNFLFCTFRRRI